MKYLPLWSEIVAAKKRRRNRSVRSVFVYAGLLITVLTWVTVSFAEEFSYQTINLDEEVIQANSDVVVNVGWVDESKLKTKVVKNGNDTEVATEINVANGQIRITPKTSIEPGKYEVIIENEEKEVFTETFLWGVLAINTNKSIYLPEETASIDIAVLDEEGKMVCDADVTLQIYNRELGIEETLSTDSGEIIVNDECLLHAYTLNPDYQTEYKVQSAGIYEMSLTAVTENGTHSIKDYFEVRENVPFDVERQTATRIYPIENYPVLINVKANRDFKGKIVETVPNSFTIFQPDEYENTLKYTEVTDKELTKKIIWNVDVKKGDNFQIGYIYDALDISPQFHLLGPLEFVETVAVVDNLLDPEVLKPDLYIGLPPLDETLETTESTNSNILNPENFPIEEVNETTNTLREPENINIDYAQPKSESDGIVNYEEFIVFKEARQWQIAVDDTGIVRPDGDSTPLQWSVTGSTSHYGAINKVVTQPTVPSTTSYVTSSSSSQTDTYTMGTLSNVQTVTSITVWMYSKSAARNGEINISVIIGGSTYSGAVSNGTSTDTYGWRSITFSSLSKTQTDLNGLEISVTPGTNKAMTIAALYAEITYDPDGTTTLGDGTDPSNATINPASGITDLDNFTFTSSAGTTDTISALTVTLGSYSGLSQVDITNTSNTAVCTAITNPSSTTLNFSGCNISVTSTTSTYKIRVTPYSHANMPAPPGGTYTITGTVTGWTGLNSTKTGTDTDSATITIDNASPSGATSTSGSAGNAQVLLSWTTSASSDYTGTVILRWAASTPGSDVPEEGNSSYTLGNTIGSSTVAYVHTGASPSTAFTDQADTNVVNGTTYSYKIFQRDSSGNYDEGVTITGSPFTPSIPNITLEGVIYDTDESTTFDCANISNLSVQLRINNTGTYSASCTEYSGNWSINAPISSGDTVTIYIDGGSTRGSLFYVSDGTTKSNLNLFVDRVVFRDDANNTITTTELIAGDTADTDDLISHTGNVTSVSANKELHIPSGTTYTPQDNVNLLGGYHNLGTVTWSTYTANFVGPSPNNNISGNLTGTSSFNKILFNYSGGIWTITDPLTATAASALDTFVIQQGTVTLGNGNGDNLKLGGKMVVGSASGTATFQTYDGLAQGSEIVIDVNDNTTPVNCANCIVQVGTTVNTDPTATFTLNENTLLRFNSYSGVQSGLEVEASGYLNVQGAEPDSGTTTTGTSQERICDSTKSWTDDQFNGMHVRISDSFANTIASGEIYEITDTLSSDANCSGSPSIVLNQNLSATDTNPTVGNSYASMRNIRPSIEMISESSQHAGRYIHNITDNSYYRISNSYSGSPDTIYVSNNSPDNLSDLATGDDIEITSIPPLSTGLSYEIYDYANINAQDSSNCADAENGYIYGKTSAKIDIQKGFLCDLGSGAITNRNGLLFRGINNSKTNEGMNIEKSFVKNFYQFYGDLGLNNTVSYNNFESADMVFSSDKGGVISGNNIYKESYVSLGGTNTIAYNNNIYSGGTNWINGIGTIFSQNRVYAINTFALESSSGSISYIKNLIYSNEAGITYEYGPEILSIEDEVGGSIGYNYYDLLETTSEPYTGGAKVTLLNSSLGSGTPVHYDWYLSDQTSVIAKKYKTSPGAESNTTRVWYNYTLPSDNSETPQSENIEKYNYADPSWTDGISDPAYIGTGTKDEDIDIGFSTSMSGSSTTAIYKLILKTISAQCDGLSGSAVFDVYRDMVDIDDVYCGQTYTDSTTNVQFNIGQGATQYDLGDSYTFVAYKGSANTNVSKSLLMSSGSSLTAPSGTNIELLGQSGSLSAVSAVSGNYSFNVAGTLNANYYSFSGLNATGLNLQSGATITSIENGTFDNSGTSGGASDTHMTVDTSLINSDINIGGMTFADTNGYAEYNVTTSGTTGSNYWTFTNALGALAGEDYDNDDGSPGMIRWYTQTPVTISGNAYEDESTTVWTGCDGSTQNISLVINGGTAATTSCSASTGYYEFTNQYTTSNEPLSVFFNGTGANTDKGVAVTVVESNTSNIVINLRKNIVWLTKQGLVASITNSDLDHCDSDSPAQCSNVPYSVATGDLTVSGATELHVESAKTYVPGGNVSLSGSLHNEGTITWGTYTTTFTSTTTGNYLSGNLNGTSAFYKLVFNGAAGAWTINDPIKVSKANGVDTFLIQQGTVTLGNGNGDNLEVNGKMIVGSVSSSATFQTYDSLAQGSQIIIDINNNASPVDCSNCIVQVGTPVNTDPQGNFLIYENTVLRLNSYSAVQTGVDVYASGYFASQGSNPASGTTTAGTSATRICDSTKTWTDDQFNGMHVRLGDAVTTTADVGDIYEISDTVSSDANCSGASSIVLNQNTSTTDTNPTVSATTNGQKTISLTTELVSTTKQHIGRYVHNITDDVYYKIIDSTTGSPDTLIIVSDIPNDYSSMTSGDDIEITNTYPMGTGVNYQILDYASITSSDNVNCTTLAQGGHIFAQTNSDTDITYTDICNMGQTSGTLDGITLNTIVNTDPNEGFTLSTSRIRDGYRGFVSNSSNSNSFINNSITNVGNTGVVLYTSAYNDISNNTVYGTTGNGINLLTSSNFNTVAYNLDYGTGGSGVILNTGVKNNTVHHNHVYGHDAYGIYLYQPHNNFVYQNDVHANINVGISIYLGNGNTVESNTIYENDSYGIQLYTAHYNIIKDNTIYTNSSGIYNFESSNNTLYSNDVYGNTNYGLYVAGTTASISNLSISDVFGQTSVNSTADVFYSGTGAHKLNLYGTSLASTTKVSGITVTNAFVLAKKYNTGTGGNGVTQLWGEYSIPADDTETPQTENIDTYNYADNLWSEGITDPGYNGTGTKDTDIDLALNPLYGGNYPAYSYKITVKNPSPDCTGEYPSVEFDVYRDLVDVGDVYCGQTFLDDETFVEFNIGQGATPYAIGDSYTFLAYEGSSDTNTTKTVTVMQSGDVFTVPSGTTLQAIGDATHKTAFSSASSTYAFNVAGTINANYYSFSGLNATGLNLQSGAIITSIENGSFDNSGTSGGSADSHMTVDTSLINSNINIGGMTFADTNGYAEYNVTTSGTTGSNYWTFTNAEGALAGESYDNDDGDPGMIRWSSTSNQAPSNPTSLVQRKVTAGTVLSTAGWTNENQVQFTATAEDPDSSDTLYLCVEKDILGTSFSDTEDLCGTGVAYSGTPVTVTVTITGLTDASQYHWHARVKDEASAYSSSWVSYDTNLESEIDFGVDTTAPTGGTVYDGTVSETDSDFNNGSLSELSANWSGIDASTSGLVNYEYSIGTSAGGTDVVTWTDNTTNTSVTKTGLTLQTSQVYYFNVRTTDNAGNVSTPISSDGILIAPSLTFTVAPSSVSFSNLNLANNYTDTQNTTLTTSTNAYGGYIIRAFISDLLTAANDVDQISNFNGGTYELPDEWRTGDTGFGYTSSDTSVQGVNKFNDTTCAGGGSSPCYAPFSTTGPGDIVADHTSSITGTPVTEEAFTITYRVTTDPNQEASTYTTTVVYTVTAQY